jgi:hypothetical protein
MSLKAYNIHHIKLLGAVPLVLPQLTERTINSRPTVIYNRGSGSPSPSMAAVVTVSPEVTFSTTDIGRIFTAVSPTTGLAIKTGNTYTGVEAYYQQKEDMGLRGGALTGIKAVGTRAILVPTTLEANIGQEARLTMMMLWVSEDGILIPISYTDGVTVPVGYASEKYTFGGAVANGATIPGVEGCTIDYGITLNAKIGGGHPYPQYVTINDLEPKITLRTPNMDVNATYPDGGLRLNDAVPGRRRSAHRFRRSGQPGNALQGSGERPGIV